MNRDYTLTQTLALQIFTTSTSSGLRWWSYYNPAWANNGVWNTPTLTVLGIQPLSITDAMLVNAARTISRLI